FAQAAAEHEQSEPWSPSQTPRQSFLIIAINFDYIQSHVHREVKSRHCGKLTPDREFERKRSAGFSSDRKNCQGTKRRRRSSIERPPHLSYMCDES
ncbi:MAG: hypothetical protein WCE42_03805, partial [Rhizobium ruizarguesonis]